MASPIASHAVMTRDKFIKGPVTDVVNNRIPFYARLKRQAKVKFRQGGLTIIPPAFRYKVATILPWAGRNQMQTVELDLHARASHGWMGFYHNWQDNKWDELEQQGEEKLADEIEENMKAVKEGWAQKFDAALFADGSASLPVGVSGLESFMKVTGTYGGVSQSATDVNSEKYFAPTIIDGSSTLTPRTYKTDPRAYLRTLATRIGDRTVSTSISPEAGPDFAITTRTIWEHTKSFYESITHQNMTVSTETVGSNARMIRAEGMDIYWSRNCTASTLYALTMSEFTAYIATSEWFATRELPSYDPIGDLHQTYFKGQPVITNNPRAHGKIISITV